MDDIKPDVVKINRNNLLNVIFILCTVIININKNIHKPDNVNNTDDRKYKFWEGVQYICTLYRQCMQSEKINNFLEF